MLFDVGTSLILISEIGEALIHMVFLLFNAQEASRKNVLASAKDKCVPLVIFNLDDDHVDRKSTAEKCARAAYYVVCSCQSLLHPLLKLLHLQCCSAKIIKSLWHISQHVPTALLDTRERERENILIKFQAFDIEQILKCQNSK